MLGKVNRDDFILGSGYVFTDKGCLDGQLAVSSVYENRELNFCRTADSHDSLQSGAGSPSGKNYVVNQYYGFVLNRKRYVCLAYNRIFRNHGEIVSVKRYIQFTDINFRVVNLFDVLSKPIGQRYSACLDAYQTQILRTVVFFYNFMRNSNENPIDILFGHYLSFNFHNLIPTKKVCAKNPTKKPCLNIQTRS